MLAFVEYTASSLSCLSFVNGKKLYYLAAILFNPYLKPFGLILETPYLILQILSFPCSRLGMCLCHVVNAWTHPLFSHQIKQVIWGVSLILSNSLRQCWISILTDRSLC
ncbi:hypothetical protein KsCSTR_34070 [Candidatus Kuenenia stuttgartiensis]|uniref:Uncharacterized protein n=1 Tax=Kuenenia stuttgartiensis TaxID=174633 RepID=Q1Q486_KUEST|nr:hypothetical protein KsCSTR_34070 [Candidatus Kuenenia stuttgartiensis]CAJ74835.1 unknown protein [Candidatus Kuenenia stuttgartiensis]